LNQNHLSRLLANLALVLLAIYTAAVLFDVLPPKLLQPDWILNATFAATSFVTVPLLAVAFVHLAGYMSPGTLPKLQLRIARLSALLALLFLLFQPMLVYAIWRNAADLAAYNKEQIIQGQAKGNELIKAIETAASFRELQVSMAKLQGPQIPDQASSIPFPALRKQLLEAIKSAQSAIPTNLKKPTSPEYLQVYRRIARTSVISLMASFGFALMAWNPVSESNILIVYLKSVGLFGITPVSLYKGFTGLLINYQNRWKQEGKIKQNRKSALQHQRQIPIRNMPRECVWSENACWNLSANWSESRNLSGNGNGIGTIHEPSLQPCRQDILWSGMSQSRKYSCAKGSSAAGSQLSNSPSANTS
jgi:hypothetical protein